VEKAAELAKLGKIKLLTAAQVTELHGTDELNGLVVKHNSKEKEDTYVEVDNFIPLFGLSPKLGPIGSWGLEIEKNAIKVNNAKDYQTNIPGVFAIGDVNTYEGKLKLILSGFHEAAVMCQYAYQIINPNKRYVMKYTTVGGVEGFDGTKKEAKKEVVQSIL
jgi:thioredoxin reductase (NADPH)